MIEHIFSWIEEHKMIEEEDSVVIGVSGGADSLCLLEVLLEYRKKVNFYPVVVYVDHGLRKEAKKEALWVKKWGEEKKVCVKIRNAEVKEYAKKYKRSEEEAGRILRYQIFEEELFLLQAENKGKIAVAHHADDQAETMLHHLFRGTGINGLAGMAPINQNVIRPLLHVTREEIEGFLKQRNISWLEDETNREDKYTRNKIRHHILPFAKQEINERAAEHLLKTSEELREINEYLQMKMKEKEKEVMEIKEGEVILYLTPMKELHPVIRKKVFFSALEQLIPQKKDITREHIKALLSLMEKKGSKTYDLPYQVKAVKEYDRMMLRKKEKEEVIEKEEKEILIKGDDILFWKEEYEIDIHHEKKEETFLIEENQYTKWFDCDKISHCLTLRTRKTGDYLVINEKGQKKSVKEYMINEKIPSSERDHIPVIADGSHVLWIIGHRISTYYKVAEDTKNMIRMTIKRRDEHGRGN